MQTRTILNRIAKHKGFVYGRERWGPADRPLCLEIPIFADKRCRPHCSGCGQARPGYDRLAERRFEFIPLWGIAIFFLYALRRVDCASCGVVVEKVPWAQGKETLCIRYQWLLASWAKKLSWTQVAEAFGTSFESVYKSVQMAVVWGLAHRKLDTVEAIGVDEIAWHKGHKYLTLVYDIGVGSKRLLYIAKDRTEESLRGFFSVLGEAQSQKLRYVCSDMWAPYLKVIAEKATQAVNILDRFHIMKKFNEAIDQLRRDEARRMKQEGGEPLLSNARWCLLKRVENLTERQASKLKELLRYNLRSVRAYLLREDFQRFWQYVRPSCAARFLDQWCCVERVAQRQLLRWHEAGGNEKPLLRRRYAEGLGTFLVAEYQQGGGRAHFALLLAPHDLDEAFLRTAQAALRERGLAGDGAGLIRPSEVVYSGPPPSAALLALASELGLRLRSLDDFECLLDLREHVAW